MPVCQLTLWSLGISLSQTESRSRCDALCPTRSGRRHWAARLRQSLRHSRIHAKPQTFRTWTDDTSHSLTQHHPGAASCSPPLLGLQPFPSATGAALHANLPDPPLLALRCVSAAPNDPHPGQRRERPPGHICHPSRHEVPARRSNQCRAHVTHARRPRKYLTPRIGEVECPK